MRKVQTARKELRALSIASSIALIAAFGAATTSSYAQPASDTSAAAQAQQSEAQKKPKKSALAPTSSPFTYDELGATPTVRLPHARHLQRTEPNEVKANDRETGKAVEKAVKTPPSQTAQ